jgi:protein O-mannosyl-transferase
MNNKLFIIILACVCLGIYAGYLNNDFVFDDKVLVEQNPLIKSVRFMPRIFKSGIYDYWSGPQEYDRMYRPLQMLSYFFDYNLWGNHPAGFRLTNLLLHLFNAALVFYLLAQIFKDRLLAQVTSFLFLVHPVQISSVAYISSRADLLSACFILSTCILFLKFLNTLNCRFYVLSLLTAGLAFLSRENALLIVFFLAVAGFGRKEFKQKLKWLAGFLIIGLLYLVLRFIIFGGSGLTVHPAYLKGAWGAVNFCNLLFGYTFLLVWPHNLGMFHSLPFIYKLSFPVIGLAISSVTFLVLLLIFQSSKKFIAPVIIFGGLWFLTGLIPAYFYLDAYPVLGRALMSEGWLYLSSAGFLVIFARLCLFNKLGRAILISAGLIFGLMVMAQRGNWRNEVVFYERIIRFLPEDNIIQKNLAAAYIQDGSFGQAARIIHKLEKYYPDTPLADALWGQYYLTQGLPRQALGYFNRILVKNFFTNHLVSLCYAKMDSLDEAIAYSLFSFSQNQLYRANIIQLAYLYQSAGQRELAKKYIVLAQELDPKTGVILK